MVICCKVKKNKQKDFYTFLPWKLNAASAIVCSFIFKKEKGKKKKKKKILELEW